MGLSCTTFGPSAWSVAPAVLVAGVVEKLWAVEATAGSEVLTVAEREVEAWMGSPPPLPASSSSSSLCSFEDEG